MSRKAKVGRRSGHEVAFSVEVARCPHCGEIFETEPDLGDGPSQTYIEDCPVCCRPNTIHAVMDTTGVMHVAVEREI